MKIFNICLLFGFGITAILYAGFPFEVELGSGIENAYEEAKKDRLPTSENEFIERYGDGKFYHDPERNNDSSYEPERDIDGRDY